jgi:hypothetical protein
MRCQSALDASTAAAERDAGVGAQHVDAAEALRRLRDQRTHVGLVRHVGADREAVDFVCDGLRRVCIHVGHHDAGCARAGETAHQRRADARGAAGDDDDLAFHSMARTFRCSTRHLLAKAQACSASGRARRPACSACAVRGVALQRTLHDALQDADQPEHVEHHVVGPVFVAHGLRAAVAWR